LNVKSFLLSPCSCINQQHLMWSCWRRQRYGSY